MRLPLLAALLVSLLAGCGEGSARAPFAESRTPPSLAPRFYPPAGWAWGYVRVGDGRVQRYGVSAPSVGPRATLLILTGYGEPAETWFETARQLNEYGYAVWILERQGQGGSERATPWRDLGHADSLDPDVAAVRALVKVVIRPRGDTPLLLLGHADGGLVALRAAQTGPIADGIVLSSPAFARADLPAATSPIGQLAVWARRLKLGWAKIPGQPGWQRETPAAMGRTSDSARGVVRQAWLTANPDLRMGGPSLGWLATFLEGADQVQAAAGHVRAPVLLLHGGRDRIAPPQRAIRACQAMVTCRDIRFPAGHHELHMESDAIRDVWMSLIHDFVRGRIAARAPPPKA